MGIQRATCIAWIGAGLAAVLRFGQAASRDMDLSTLPLRTGPENAVDVDLRGLGVLVGTPQTVVTSRHIVRDCRRVVVADETGRPHLGDVQALDARNDLALLSSQTLQGRPLALRTAPPVEALEEVWHLRPGRSSPQGNEMQISRARIADLARRDDSRLLTLLGARDDGAAAFLPGDSGGPVVDGNGLLVGLVVGTVTGEQAHASEFVADIGFALNVAIIELFLQANDVAFDVVTDAAGDFRRARERLNEYAVTIYCQR